VSKLFVEQLREHELAAVVQHILRMLPEGLGTCGALLAGHPLHVEPLAVALLDVLGERCREIGKVALALWANVSASWLQISESSSLCCFSAALERLLKITDSGYVSVLVICFSPSGRAQLLPATDT
jgi:hypothetical protein